jgi:hexosaminidase
LFPSPWFHIGFDEPWELERAGSILGGVDPASLYIERLKQTIELVQKAGKRPMFWADVKSGAQIFEKYPALLSQLPKSVIAVPWHYEPLPDYSAFVVPFAHEHIPQVVAPAIWCWNEIAPDYSITFRNIDGFVRDGRKFGALGVMNTG